MAEQPQKRAAHVSIAEQMAPAERPPTVKAMIGTMIGLENCIQEIARQHDWLRSSYEKNGIFTGEPDVPEGFEYQDLPPEAVDWNARTSCLVERSRILEGMSGEHTLRRWNHARDMLAWQMRDWRDALHRIRGMLPQMAPLMDDPKEIAAKRWTTRLRALLGAIGGHWPALNSDMLPPIDDAEFTRGLKRHLDKLRGFTDELKALGPEAVATDVESGKSQHSEADRGRVIAQIRMWVSEHPKARRWLREQLRSAVSHDLEYLNTDKPDRDPDPCDWKVVRALPASRRLLLACEMVIALHDDEFTDPIWDEPSQEYGSHTTEPSILEARSYDYRARIMIANYAKRLTASDAEGYLAIVRRTFGECDPIDASGTIWITSADASKWSGLSTETIRVRAKREQWTITRQGRLICYDRADLKHAWPTKKFETGEPTPAKPRPTPTNTSKTTMRTS